MVKEALGFRAALWPATDTDALFNRAVNQIGFRCFCENHIQSLMRDFRINLLHPELLLQPSSPYRLLPHLRRCIADGKAFVVKVPIFPQTRNNDFHNSLISPWTLEQSVAQFGS